MVARSASLPPSTKIEQSKVVVVMFFSCAGLCRLLEYCSRSKGTRSGRDTITHQR